MSYSAHYLWEPPKVTNVAAATDAAVVAAFDSVALKAPGLLELLSHLSVIDLPGGYSGLS